MQDTTPAALGVRSGVRDAPHYDLCKLPLCILRCCCSAFYTSLASNALDTEVQRVHQDCGMWLPAPPKPVCAHGSVYGAFLGVVRRYIFFAGLGFRLVESLSWATCLHQRLATVGGPTPTSVSLVLRSAAVVSAVRLRQLTGGTLCQALVSWPESVKGKRHFQQMEAASEYRRLART